MRERRADHAANEEACALVRSLASPPPSPSCFVVKFSFFDFFLFSPLQISACFLCFFVFAAVVSFIVLRFTFVINLQRCANYCLVATAAQAVSGKLPNAGKLSTPKNRKKNQFGSFSPISYTTPPVTKTYIICCVYNVRYIRVRD